MPKKYLTIKDLLAFCEQTNLNSFSSKDADGPIVLQSFGEIQTSDTTTMGLTPCTLMACHTELNRNQSYIEEDVMNNALASFSNRPILAYVHQLEDGTWNFYDHRIAVEEDEDGETRINYLEQPIGVVPESCNARLEYDEEHDKNYVVVNGLLYDDYGNRAVDIINANDGKVDVSVEIAINQMSYNAKDKYLNIEDFTFMGVTCLGKTPDGDTVHPGMEGANLKLDNFSAEENSMFSNNYQDKLVEVLDKLNTTLSNFNKTETQKGGSAEMGKFEELLEKYGKTVEDITFEYAEMTDEELEAKFAELFDETDDGADDGADSGADDDDAGEESEPEPEPVADEEGDGDGEEEGEEDDDDDQGASDDDDEQKKKKFELTFELSHDDVRCALYNLLRTTSEEDYWSTWILDVYDNYFIYENYNADTKFSRQKYTKDGDNITFDGEPVAVFSEWLTQEERDALATLKAEYAELKSFKEQYDAAEVKAEKDAIFESAEYAEIKDTEDFKALIEDADKYSTEDLKIKADLLFADFMKKKLNFAVEKPEEKHSVGINVNSKPNLKAQAYAGLFEDEE
jgi:hypothetical protein